MLATKNIERAERNLRRWIRTSRLPPEFPVFQGPPSDFTQIYERREGAEYEAMYNDIVGSPRTLLSFAPGQGASTALDAIIRNALNARLRVQQIFVKIEPATFQEADMLNDLLCAIRQGVAHNLLLGEWEGHFHDQKLIRLYSVLDVADERELAAKRLKVELALQKEPSGGAACLLEALDSYRNREAELLFDVYSNLGLSTMLIFDFPHDLDEDLAGEMIQSVKWFNDRMKSRHGPSAAISEAYFTSKRHAGFIENSWARDFRKVNVPPYTQQELWHVLETRFQPRQTGRPLPLSTIFSEAFVSRVYSERKPFTQMMREIREEMLYALDIEENHIPHMLSPR